MSFFHFVYFSLLLIGAAGSPFKSESAGAGHRVAIRSMRQKLPTYHPNADRMFNSEFAKQDHNQVLSKYAMAAQFLDGVGLTPEEAIPFVLGFKPFEDPADLSPESSEKNSTQGSADSMNHIPHVPVHAATTGTASMPLRDYMSGTMDILYYGPMNIGTPSQELTVDVDTGSADLWVPANCQRCTGTQFQPSKSTTYQDQHKKFSVSYGSGDVSGKLVEETVSVGGLTVQKQAMGAVNVESADFDDYPNSGLLGMAFGSIASSGKPTFFENLLSENKLATPFFSVHLTRNQDRGSEVCFGCYDSAKAVGPVVWTPVKSKTYWSIAMNGLKVNSNRSVQTDIVAAIDTGTTLIYVPETIADSFYDLIDGAKRTDQYGPGFYTFPCSSNLDIAFSLGGSDFSINQYDFNLGRTGYASTDCVGGILSLGDGFPTNLAIIGDEFLKSWYSVYDYSNGARVGFAPSVNNK